MRIVVDTSVVVSALLRNRDPEKVLMLIATRPDCEWVVSQDILNEYAEVLRRPKFALPPEIVDRWMTLLETLAFQIEVPTEVAFPRDPRDAMFLACAMAADADFLITSDKDFTQATRLLRTYIVSVSQFLALVAGPT